MPETVQSESEPPETRFQCRHMRASGRRCGIAALRGDLFCYYHIASRRAARRPPNKFEDPTLMPFGLPIIEDRASIQLALSHIITRIASNELDTKRAGKLLYALQLAATNLSPAIVSRPRTTSEVPTAAEPETPMQDPVIDKLFGILAPIAIFHPVRNSQPTSLPTLTATIEAKTSPKENPHIHLPRDQRPHCRNSLGVAALTPDVAAIEDIPAHLQHNRKTFVASLRQLFRGRPLSRLQLLLRQIISAHCNHIGTAIPNVRRESIATPPHLPQRNTEEIPWK